MVDKSMENSGVKIDNASSSEGEDDAELLCVKKCLEQYVRSIKDELTKNLVSTSKPGDPQPVVKEEILEDVTPTVGTSRENRLTSIIEQLRINSRHKDREEDSKLAKKVMISKVKGGGNSDQGGGGGGTTKVRNHRRRGPAASNNNNNGPSLEIISPAHNNNNIGSPLHAAGIKSESSLSPHYHTPEWSSSRSRSVTPSSCSFPGTPPQSAADRGPSPSHPAQSGHMSQTGTLGAQPPVLGSLGHTASLPGQPPHALRNYSDFMRSLAAKYNNPNSNDFFRTSLTNGLDPLATLKPPPLNLLPPHSHPASQSVPAPPPQTPVGGLFANYSFSQGGPKTVSAFPSMLDMSSTKALLAIARVANATKDTEFQIHGKGVKRSPNKDSTSSTFPLDLSSAASVFSPASKKLRMSPKDESDLNDSGSLTGDRERSPGLDVRNLSIKNGSLDSIKINCSRSDAGSPASSGRKSPSSTGRKSPGSSSSKDCGSVNCCRIDKKDCAVGSQEVSAWSIDEVCKFVESIDICAEYSPILFLSWFVIAVVINIDWFTETSRVHLPPTLDGPQHIATVKRFLAIGPGSRLFEIFNAVIRCYHDRNNGPDIVSMFKEQSIDGAGLPLLTEDHLTGLLKMKLGPALKLRALLRVKMNSCNHCRSHHTGLGVSLLPKNERPPSAASEDS